MSEITLEKYTFVYSKIAFLKKKFLWMVVYKASKCKAKASAPVIGTANTQYIWYYFWFKGSKKVFPKLLYELVCNPHF